MPSSFLSAAVGLPNSAWTTVLSLTLDPGAWYVAWDVECEQEYTPGTDTVDGFFGRLYDGESTFYGQSQCQAGIVSQASGPRIVWGQMNGLAFVDGTGWSVPTTIYLQVEPHVSAGSPTCHAEAQTPFFTFGPPTWLWAVESGGGGGLTFPFPPTTWSASTVHSGLTGSGSIALSSPNNGVEINATTIPASWGFADWTPTHYIPAWAEIAFAAPGDIAQTHLLHEVNNILFQPYGAATEVFYSIKPGWTATITEVHGT